MPGKRIPMRVKRAAVRLLFSEGLSCRQAARRLGIGYHSVWRAARGIAGRPRPQGGGKSETDGGRTKARRHEGARPRRERGSDTDG
jgi:transposase